MEQQPPPPPPLPQIKDEAAQKPTRAIFPSLICVCVCVGGKRGGGGGEVEVGANFPSILFKIVGGLACSPRNF